MSTVILSVDHRSPAQRAGVEVGERLLSVNGHEIADVLDYRFYCYDPVLALELETPGGEKRSLSIRKLEGQELGLNFESYLMDEPRPCANHCLFCFVDQMPPGMRDTLYFKDDDARLSFLMGNYITLTNLSEREAQRIIDLKISPINVSVQTTDPDLRRRLLGNVNADKSLAYMRAFGAAGIVMNGQIVVCPGWNDGAHLRRSLSDLMDIGFASCSIVPVGLTKYRQGLAKIGMVDRDTAREILDITDEYGALCLERYGTRKFFCADELYIRAERPLPQAAYYEEYAQLENGVGMLRSFLTEFDQALADVEPEGEYASFTSVTGSSAYPFFQEMAEKAMERVPGLRGEVVGVHNDFFGRTIDVAGLLTGGDVIAQLRERDLGDHILLPVNMLRHGVDVFLDDLTVSDLEQALHRPVTVVEQDGYSFLDAILTKKGSERR